MDRVKSRCDVPSGNTQGWVFPFKFHGVKMLNHNLFLIG